MSSGYDSHYSTDRFPPLKYSAVPVIGSSSSRTPEKAIYSAAPVKSSLRQAPTYESIYGTSTPPDQPRPTLRAYDIDLSIHIDARAPANGSTVTAVPRLGKLTCTFNEIDAYRPKTQKDLPLIVKPLRQLSTSSATPPPVPTSAYPDKPRSKSSEVPIAPGCRNVSLARRSTMGSGDDPRKEKAWYSTSCDGPPSNSNSLPRNFVRRPTVLHAAAPVEIDVIPFIDDDSAMSNATATPFPPAKPARSYTDLNPVDHAPQPILKLPDTISVVARPIQFVDDVDDYRPLNRRASPPRAARQPAVERVPQDPYRYSATPYERPLKPVDPFTRHKLPDTVVRIEPFRPVALSARDPEPPPVLPTSTLPPLHLREDSGYRSDRKSSLDLCSSSSVSPVKSSPPLSTVAARFSPRGAVASRSSSNAYTANESSGTEEDDFDWGDDYLNSRRCSLVLRTQTSLRVKTIIDKLLTANGRDQRRALFSLKQIFQDDKDLVHEFVQNGGLDCMIRLGRTADQNHQNYILRALGQVMLYVDGMNGIIAHNATIQWLYELLDSPLFDEDEFKEMSPYRVEWFRLVVKTALKLLLVFIEYNDNNALLVLTAISVVDKTKAQPDWTNMMKVLSEKDSPDPETLVYALTVINKSLHGIPDRDTFYDAVDTLDTLGMEEVMSRLQKTGNSELLEQCKLYERELNQEDERGDSEEDSNTVKMRRDGHSPRSPRLRSRFDLPDVVQHAAATASNIPPTPPSVSPPAEETPPQSTLRPPPVTFRPFDTTELDNILAMKVEPTEVVKKPPTNGWSYTDGGVLLMKPLRRVSPMRRESDQTVRPDAVDREPSPPPQKVEVAAAEPETQRFEVFENGVWKFIEAPVVDAAAPQAEPTANQTAAPLEAATVTHLEAPQDQQDVETASNSSENNENDWSFSQQSNRSQPTESNDRRAAMRRRHHDAKQRQEEHIAFAQSRGVFNKQDEIVPQVSKNSTLPWRNGAVEDKTPSIMDCAPQPTQNGTAAKKIPEPLRIVENQENEQPTTPLEEDKHVRAPPPSFPTLFSPTEPKTMEFPDPIVTKAPEPEPEDKPVAPRAKIVKDDMSGGFAAMLQKRAAKAAESNRDGVINRESEAEVQWKKASENLKSRPLIINDLDFSEFHGAEYEQDPLVMARAAQLQDEQDRGYGGGGIPPPPPPGGIPLPPRLLGKGLGSPAPPAPPPPPMGGGLAPPPPPANIHQKRDLSPGPQSRGVLKLHWKPAAVEPPPVPSLKQKGTFWHGLDLPQFDANKLVQLFETKQQKEVVVKKAAEAKPQMLQVLDMKRSQAINIGLTKLPPTSVIPAAIMKFDSLVLNKDGIEKILKTMMPTDPEIEKISIKHAENPEMTLGPAEQFLMKLHAIPCLMERLKLWLFTLDYKSIEKDIAEPLMDLQLAMKEMEESKTFKTAMGMLLAIGNSLCGTEIKGFYLDYLTKASEVKDPVYKHPLTYHLAEHMVDHYPEGTDLYSEFGAVARFSRIDYKELQENLQRLEKECKQSWEYLTKISKNDNSSMKQKINEYLLDVAARIQQLKDILRLSRHRWHSFLMYFGYSVKEIPDTPPNEVFKMVTEFALEYRTTRDKILQQRKRIAEKRERNKTRGKMWATEGAAENGSPQRRRAPANTIAPKCAEERHDELSRVLTNLADGDGTLRRRARPIPDKTPKQIAADIGDGDSPDDEILNSLAKAATMPSEARDQRRRARQFNRKSLRRTRTLKLVDGQLETEY